MAQSISFGFNIRAQEAVDSRLVYSGRPWTNPNIVVNPIDFGYQGLVAVDTSDRSFWLLTVDLSATPRPAINVASAWTRIRNIEDFSTTAMYTQNDIVVFGGVIYIALSDLDGSSTALDAPNVDTTNWRDLSSTGNTIAVMGDFRLMHRGAAVPLEYDASARTFRMTVVNQRDSQRIYELMTGVADADNVSNDASQDFTITFLNSDATDTTLTVPSAAVETGGVSIELIDADTYPGFAHPAGAFIDFAVLNTPAYQTLRDELASIGARGSTENFGNNEFTIADQNGDLLYGAPENLVGTVEVINGIGI